MYLLVQNDNEKFLLKFPSVKEKYFGKNESANLQDNNYC